jgi:hypothetical protein
MSITRKDPAFIDFYGLFGWPWNFSIIIKLSKIKSIQSFDTQQEKCIEINRAMEEKRKSRGEEAADGITLPVHVYGSNL